MHYLTAVDEKGPLSSSPENKVSSETQVELSASTSSSVFDDHDYVCSRGSKVVTVSKEKSRRANIQHEVGGNESKTASREVNTFWKVGHDHGRRKLCIVGFNWNSSQLRLNKLSAGKSGTSSSLVSDSRMKPKEKSSRSKVALASCESTSVVETTMQTVSTGAGDRTEVVKNTGQQPGGGTKRRSKVYIYKPRASTTTTDCAGSAGARSTAAKPTALVNKPTREKSGTDNTVDETVSAVESIVPPDDLYTTLEASVPQRAGEYTIHLSSKGPSKLPVTTARKMSPDYGYRLSSLQETGSGISSGCEMVSAAAVSLQPIIEGGVQRSTSLSTAPLGIPSPFLLQTGLEQALGFAAFHPMSPSTSSSSCSRVAGDDWTANDEEDLAARPDSDGASRPTVMASNRWIRGSANTYIHGHSDDACGSGDAAALCSTDRGSLSNSQPEQIVFDELSTPFSIDGDLRYQSSSFVVCEDNWDGYQREEQIDECWPQHSPPFTAVASRFGRKSATSRLPVSDTGVITTFEGEGASFVRSGGRSDRRRKPPDDKRSRKSMSGTEGDVIAVPGSDRPEAASASKKSCRQRSYGDGSKRSAPSMATAHTESEVDNMDAAEKTSSNRRRKQPASLRTKYAKAIETLCDGGSDGIQKAEGASKKRGQSRSSRGQLKSDIKNQNSTVR